MPESFVIPAAAKGQLDALLDQLTQLLSDPTISADVKNEAQNIITQIGDSFMSAGAIPVGAIPVGELPVAARIPAVAKAKLDDLLGQLSELLNDPSISPSTQATGQGIIKQIGDSFMSAG